MELVPEASAVHLLQGQIFRFQTPSPFGPGSRKFLQRRRKNIYFIHFNILHCTRYAAARTRCQEPKKIMLPIRTTKNRRTFPKEAVRRLKSTFVIV